MENSDLNLPENLKREDSSREPISQEETSFNQGLTNEEKLEYLSQLIQRAEQNLEQNGKSKKLVK